MFFQARNLLRRISTGILLFSVSLSASVSILSANDFFDAQEWISTDVNTNLRFSSLQYDASQIWYGSHFYIGTDWTRIGKIWMHPGANAPSVRTFTAPKDGNVKIRGTMRKLHLSGDGVIGRIECDGEEIWNAKIEGTDSRGASHDLSASLRAGSKVRFILSSGPEIFCDTTEWNPSIVYDDETFTAAEGFENSESSCWSYEMENPDVQELAVTQSDLDTLREVLQNAVSEGCETPQDAALWRLLLEEWKRDDMRNGTFQNTEAHLKSARTLFDFLMKNISENKNVSRATLDSIEKKLAELEETAKNDPKQLQNPAFYMQVRVWKRAIVFENPQIQNVSPILFVKRLPTSYDHLVMQYFGWRAQRGGTLCVLQNPGKSLQFVDILGGKMEGGNIADPCISRDGKRVLFAYVEIGKNSVRFPWKEAWTPQVSNEIEESHHEYYHIYEVGIDGQNLRQLTTGFYEDVMPAYLPDGNIVFVSSRRKGHPRCFWWGFGNRWTTYTIHKMGPNGENVAPLSWHETNEWYPTVGHDGQIFYSRWDYIDRDAVTHQNLWSMRPDGTNPAAVWGNASLDIFATFQAKPIPSSRKWILTASAHHSCTGGSLVILDPSVAKDGPKAIERITPEIPFPEAEGNDIPQFYASPWPLSEDFYLCAYSPYRLEFEPKATKDAALGLYVLDRFGNRELLYRDASIGCDSPQPLAARPIPPVLPSFLPENAPKEGRFFVQDIYQGVGNEAKRGSIKALRIVQIFPKTTITGNEPPIGLAGEENGRAVLGTVPVEPDGSVNFIAPAQKPILFQALNEKGEAFQIMRSLTYLQPGEEIACIGCHEDRTTAVGGVGNSPYFSPASASESESASVAGTSDGASGTDCTKNIAKNKTIPLAAAREPSQIAPGKFDGRPFSYMEVVQPILDAKCVECHGANPQNEVFQKTPIDLTRTPDGEFCRSYVTLMKRNPTLVPRWPQRNRVEMTLPGGEHGAIGSGLKKILSDENHKNVPLTPEEWARFAMWIDQNAIFYGTTDADLQKDQRLGKPVPMQEIQ